MDTVTKSMHFTDWLDQIVDIQMFMQTKKDGKITRSDPLKLDPCSTLDLDKFSKPRKGSEASMNFLQKYKPLQCLDESANLNLTPTRQQSSQVLNGVSVNDRVKAERGGQDVVISGDSANRHEDWRELLF